MNEWLTTGELVDQLKCGQFAESNDGKMQVTREYSGHITDVSDGKFVFLNAAIVNSKWRIIPYVGWNEAQEAMKKGKKVRFVYRDTEVTLLLDDATDDFCTPFTFNELLNGKFIIIEK